MTCVEAENVLTTTDDMCGSRKCVDNTGKLEDCGPSQLLTTLLSCMLYEPKRPSPPQHYV